MEDWKLGGIEDAKAILDNCSLAVHFVDSEGVIIYANQAELDCIGYTVAEYIGQNIARFHASQETIGDIFYRLKHHETLLNYEAELRRKDGAIIVVQINSNVFWRNGEFVHTRCFTRDITDLKRAQLQVLEGQRLRLQEAEECKRKQNDFIDMLCHELRNPLNGALGLLACAREELDGLRDPVRGSDTATAELKMDHLGKFLEHIDECAQHQRVIMDDVLNLSRLGVREPTVDNTTFDPQRTLGSVISMFDGVARLKGLRFAIDTDEMLRGPNALVVADENCLKQILINLVSNAVKFSRDGGNIAIKLGRAADRSDDSDKRLDRGTVYVYLEGCVQDSGVGITEEEQALLFTPFAAPKRKRVLEYGGSGLGLRITKELVALMHGSISVRSKIGDGSTFSFVVRCGLPRGPQASPEAPISGDSPLVIPAEVAAHMIEPEELPSSNGLSGTNTSVLRVLVCEDNLINQIVLSRYLARGDIEYVIASSGEEALNLYRKSLSRIEAEHQRPFGLIFMDIELPGMSGIETTLQIRKVEEENGRKRRVPVVCMSGYTRSEYKLMAFGVGMNYYISKPFSKAQVYQLIDKYAMPSETTPEA